MMVLMPILLVTMNLGLGASISFADIRQATTRWKGLLVAQLCQFGIMPSAACLMALTLGVTKLQALSMIVIGCCPGGALSNLYAYYSRSDLPLSILATVCSTLVGIVAMPVLISIYSRPFSEQHAQIPVSSMLIPIALVVVAVTLGMTVNHYNKPLARRVEKMGSMFGVVFMAMATLGVFVQVRSIRTSWQIWVAGIALMPLGGFLGFSISLLVGLPRASAQTICFETGLQNAAVGMTVLTFAFPDKASFDEASMFPLIFLFFNNIIGPLILLLFRLTVTEEVGAKDAGSSSYSSSASDEGDTESASE